MTFEYVPGGSLDQYNDLSILKKTQVLYQLSSALEYLHNRKPSIAHRDIKPENILVERNRADGIRVKFADFGLSKVADALKTECGTRPFSAPEIHLKYANRIGAAEDLYSVSVDIWSLGVVIAWLVCGLPAYYDRGWIHGVQARVNDYYVKNPVELIRLVRDGMLVEDPDKRWSADRVTDEALKILGIIGNESVDEGSATPTPSIVGARSVVESASFVTELDDEGSATPTPSIVGARSVAESASFLTRNREKGRERLSRLPE